MGKGIKRWARLTHRWLSRQIKAHWEIMHRNSHNLKSKSQLQTSEPAGGREKVSACEKPSPALHFLWQAITCTPAWEEKFVRERLRTEEIFQQTIKTKKDAQLMIKTLETQLVEEWTLFK